MANTLVPQDAYAIINAVAKQMQGRDALTAYDTSSFVAVGEQLLSYGYTNLMGAVSTVLGRTIIATRKYDSKLRLIDVDEDRWGAMTRKISFLPKDAQSDKHMNTNLNPSALDNGNSVDPWVINKPEAVQFNFIGVKTYQRSITRFKDQIDQAFRSEADFIAFVEGYMMELGNDIEQDYEARKRMSLLNFIGGVNDLGTYVVDLVAEFNTYMGNPSPALTRADCFSPTHIEKFFENSIRVIGEIRDRMTERSNLYHYTPTTVSTDILRHTPKSNQKFLVYSPFMKYMETMVNPNLFHEIDMERTEEVSYWQSITTPSSVNVTPNVLDLTTGNSVNGSPQSIDYVVGLLFDEEAIGMNRQFEIALSSGMNPFGLYENTVFTWKFLALNDYTENAVLFVLGA